MKKILIPIDFSPSANNAIEFAAQLAQIIKAEIRLVHAQQLTTSRVDNSIYDLVEDYYDDRKIVEKKLKNYCKELTNEFNVKCTFESVLADFENAIKTLEKTKKPDLIVMGTNGEDSLMDYLFGTHTFHVIAEVKCPVLVVPVFAEFTNIKKVIYASNYQKGDAISLHQINKLLWTFKPKVTVLHISRHDTLASEETFVNYSNQLKEVADKDLDLNFVRLLENNVPEAIDDYMDRTDADLLTVCTRHLSFFERIFNKSITRALTVTTDRPILIFHE